MVISSSVFIKRIQWVGSDGVAQGRCQSGVKWAALGACAGVHSHDMPPHMLPAVQMMTGAAKGPSARAAWNHQRSWSFLDHFIGGLQRLWAGCRMNGHLVPFKGRLHVWTASMPAVLGLPPSKKLPIGLQPLLLFSVVLLVKENDCMLVLENAPVYMILSDLGS